jgi:chitinase
MSFSFFFFFTKMQTRKAKQVLSGGWHQWEGGGYKEGYRRVNMAEILGTHVCKQKNETC